MDGTGPSSGTIEFTDSRKRRIVADWKGKIIVVRNESGIGEGTIVASINTPRPIKEVQIAEGLVLALLENNELRFHDLDKGETLRVEKEIKWFKIQERTNTPIQSVLLLRSDDRVVKVTSRGRGRTGWGFTSSEYSLPGVSSIDPKLMMLYACGGKEYAWLLVDETVTHLIWDERETKPRVQSDILYDLNISKIGLFGSGAEGPFYVMTKEDDGDINLFTACEPFSLANSLSGDESDDMEAGLYKELDGFFLHNSEVGQREQSLRFTDLGALSMSRHSSGEKEWEEEEADAQVEKRTQTARVKRSAVGEKASGERQGNQHGAEGTRGRRRDSGGNQRKKVDVDVTRVNSITKQTAIIDKCVTKLTNSDSNSASLGMAQDSVPVAAASDSSQEERTPVDELKEMYESWRAESAGSRGEGEEEGEGEGGEEAEECSSFVEVFREARGLRGRGVFTVVLLALAIAGSCAVAIRHR